MTFDPREICRELNSHGVKYVVIGGFAAAVHGSPLPTEDIDIVPAGDKATSNVSGGRSRPLARIRTATGPVATRLDGPFLAAMPVMLNLTTAYGDLDLTFRPAGPLHNFSEWSAGAGQTDIAIGVPILIAALDDVIASKQAAGREKDERALPYLQSLRDELRGD
jgi:hypothetical protein